MHADVAILSGSGIAEDKSLGWLRQLRLTPLSPARVVVGLILALLVSLGVLVAAVST